MAEQRTIRETIAEETRSGFQKVNQTVAGHTREVLGDVIGSLVDDVKNMTSGAMNMLTGGFRGIFGGGVEEKQLDEEKEQTSILSNILGVFKRQEKRRLASFGDRDERGLLSGFGAMFIGGAIGGMISSLLPGVLIIGGIITVAVSAIRGYFNSEKGNVSKLSGIVGNILGGSGRGIINAFSNAGKGALGGAGIGFFVGGLPGAAIGGIVGAAIGGIMGYFGGKFFAKNFDRLINRVFLGGNRSLIGQFKTIGAGTGLGATIGIVGGLPGILIGATIGAAIGGIISFFGKDKITSFTSDLKSKLSNGGNEMINPSRWFGHDDEREAGTGNRRMNLLGRMTKTLDDWGSDFNNGIGENITKPLTFDLPAGIKTAGQKLSDGGNMTMGNPMNWLSNKEMQAGTGDIAYKRGLLENIINGLKDGGNKDTNMWNPAHWEIVKDTKERGFIKAISDKLSNGGKDENNMGNPAHWEIVKSGKDVLKNMTDKIQDWGSNSMWNPSNWFGNREVQAGTGDIAKSEGILSKIVNEISDGGKNSTGNPTNWNTENGISKGVNIVKKIAGILMDFGNRINPFVGKDSETAKSLKKMRKKQEKLDKPERTSDPTKGREALKNRFNLLKPTEEEPSNEIKKQLKLQPSKSSSGMSFYGMSTKDLEAQMMEMNNTLNKMYESDRKDNKENIKQRNKGNTIIQQNLQNIPTLSPGDSNMVPSDIEDKDIRERNKNRVLM